MLTQGQPSTGGQVQAQVSVKWLGGPVCVGGEAGGGDERRL